MNSPSFFGQFLTHASQVGSILPSSRFLTRKMLPVTLPWHKMMQIAELGPGTGVFTQYIQQNRSARSQLYLFEQNGTFRGDLERRYPELTVLDDGLKLADNGILVAFQYTLLLRRKFQTRFSLLDTGYTWMNVPPAWVFKCKKRRVVTDLEMPIRCE